MFHSAEHLEADLAQLQFQNQTTLVSCACDSDELGCVSRTVSMWDNMGFVDAIVNYSEGGKAALTVLTLTSLRCMAVVLWYHLSPESWDARNGEATEWCMKWYID
jgi:hypothetical protein